MGKHSSNDKRGKNRRIAVVGALILGVATAITPGPIGRAAVSTAAISAPAAAGGGGSTGNAIGGGNGRG